MRLCPNARSACVAAQYPTSIHHQKHLYVHSTGHTSQRSRCCAAAGASQPRPTSQGGLPFHPTALLDISCSACCLVLLANSAARSLANRPEPRAAAGTDLQQQGRTSTGHAASDPQQTDAHGTPPTTSCHSDGEATAKTSAAVLLPPAEVAARGPDTRLAAQHGLAGEVVLALLLVSSLSNAVYKIGAGRPAAASRGQTQQPTTEAAARLARLEALTDKQLSELTLAARQIDKLQIRTRVTGGDLKRPIVKLQNATTEQAVVLTKLAGEVEALRNQLRDTQQLLLALQGLAAKQFQVTVDAIKQLRSRQATG